MKCHQEKKKTQFKFLEMKRILTMKNALGVDVLISF